MANAAPVPTATKPTNLKYPWENPRNPSGDCITAAYFVCFFFQQFLWGMYFFFPFRFFPLFSFRTQKKQCQSEKKATESRETFRVPTWNHRYPVDNRRFIHSATVLLGFTGLFFFVVKTLATRRWIDRNRRWLYRSWATGFLPGFFFKDHWARFHRMALSCGGLFRFILIFFSRTTDLTRPKWFTSRGLLWGPLLRFNLGTSWSFAFSSSAIVSFLYFRVLIFCFPLHSFLRVFPFALVSFFLFVCFCTTADPDAYRVLWTENDRVSTKLVSIIFFSFAKPETSGRNTTFDFIFPWWATTR